MGEKLGLLEIAFLRKSTPEIYLDLPNIYDGIISKNHERILAANYSCKKLHRPSLTVFH